MKNEKIVHLICLFVAVAVMMLPWSVNWITVESGTDGTAAHEVVNHSAYYDFGTLQSGHVGPFLTMVITVLLVAVVLLSVFDADNKGLKIASVVLSGAGIATSVLCLIPHGLDAFTIGGMTILLVLVYSLVLSILYIRGKGFTDYEDDDDE